jgi:hypothetical protein
MNELKPVNKIQIQHENKQEPDQDKKPIYREPQQLKIQKMTFSFEND